MINESLYQKVATLLEPTRLCLQHICQKHLYFHLSFAALITLEALLLGVFFPLLIDAFFLGLAIAIIFFTTLLYFILSIYYNEQKPEEMSSLRNEFLAECRAFFPKDFSNEEASKALSDCSYFMAEDFQKTKFDAILLPNFISFAQPYVNSFFIRFLQKDLVKIAELFLFSSIEEEIKVIKIHPTKIETHGRLASLFMALADLYSQNQEKRKIALTNSIEELRIITHLSPKNCAACEALANCFIRLDRMNDALLQYETLNQLKPSDPPVLFQLGKLYLGRNESGKGLAIYDELKKYDEKKAEELLEYYGKTYTCGLPQAF